MTRQRRFKQEDVINALEKTGGLKGPAANILHCARRTITRYIEHYPAVKEAYEDAVEATVDLAQAKMIALVEREDWRAIRFLLVTLGKDRGFTERQEIVAVDDDREAVRQRFLDDYRRVYGEEDDEE